MIPHLLGFHPSESLVVVLVQEGRVELTARADLQPLLQAGQADLLVQRLWGRFPLADAWFVAYTADHAAGWRLLDRCQELVRPATGRVMLVHGETFWCDSATAEPGRLDPRAGVLAAEATFLGLPARASRDDLRALVSGPADADIAGLIEAFEQQQRLLELLPMRQWPHELAAAVEEFIGDGDVPDDAHCARLALLAQNPDARDRALVAITRESAEQHVALWGRVVSRCLARYQAFPLGLMGMAAWVAGNGALQVICLERAEQQLPDSGLVRILASINENVVPPSSWDSIRASLLTALGAKVRAGSRRTGRRRK